jgi:hypothetical protein
MKCESNIELEIRNRIVNKGVRMGVKFGLDRKDDIKKADKRKICYVFELSVFSEMILRYFPDQKKSIS